MIRLGGSLVAVIPRPITLELGLSKGDQLTVYALEGMAVLINSRLLTGGQLPPQLLQLLKTLE